MEYSKFIESLPTEDGWDYPTKRVTVQAVYKLEVECIDDGESNTEILREALEFLRDEIQYNLEHNLVEADDFDYQFVGLDDSVLPAHEVFAEDGELTQ